MNEFECSFYLDPRRKIQIGNAYNLDLQSEITNILTQKEGEIKEHDLKEGLIDAVTTFIRVQSAEIVFDEIESDNGAKDEEEGDTDIEMTLMDITN